MKNEKSLRNDLNKMEKVKRFDVDTFAKYMAWNQPSALGNYHFIEEESDEVEAFIMQRLNIKEVKLITGVNSKFLNATNIRRLNVATITDTLWKMDWLNSLTIERMGGVLTLPNAFNGLSQLKSLNLYAKNITLDCGESSSIETLFVQGVSRFIFEEGTVFTNLTTLNFISISDDFSMDFGSLKRVFPNLKQINGAKYAYSIYRFEKEILNLLPHLKFFYTEDFGMIRKS